MDPGCLAGARMDDLTCRPVDHDGLPLGRFPDTLQLEHRDDGMHWSVELPESRSDIREAVERGDLRATSWRMRVGSDRWEGDIRHVVAVEELRDVSLAVSPAYPDAVAEFRTAPQEDPMSAPTTPLVEDEQRIAPEPLPDPEPPPAARGTLRVADHAAPTAARGLADEFRSRGFPGETATVEFERVFEQRAVTWTGSVDNLNPTRRSGAPLAFDQRYAWPAFGRIGVDVGTTAVQVMRQSGRTLADPATVIRAIDAVSAKRRRAPSSRSSPCRFSRWRACSPACRTSTWLSRCSTAWSRATCGSRSTRRSTSSCSTRPPPRLRTRPAPTR
jgi:hypothetical protein